MMNQVDQMGEFQLHMQNIHRMIIKKMIISKNSMKVWLEEEKTIKNPTKMWDFLNESWYSGLIVFF